MPRGRQRTQRTGLSCADMGYERGQRRRFSQSVEVGDIGVVPHASRNRPGSAAAHERDDIEGRSDARKQPAPPGPESGEGAARSAGTPRVIEYESARIR